MNYYNKVSLYKHTTNILYHNGYDNFDKQQLIEILAGFRKLGYTHIHNKEALMLATLDWIHEQEQTLLFNEIDLSLSSTDKLYMLLRKIQAYICDNNYFLAVLQLGNTTRANVSGIRTYCKFYYQYWIDQFSSLINDIGNNNSNVVATNIVTQIIGASLMCQLYDDMQGFEHTVIWVMQFAS